MGKKFFLKKLLRILLSIKKVCIFAFPYEGSEGVLFGRQLFANEQIRRRM